MSANSHVIDFHRLRWQCRRGMLELDVLLLNFVEHYFDQLSTKELIIFNRLLQEDDPTLARWFLGNEPADDSELTMMVNKIKKLRCKLF